MSVSSPREFPLRHRDFKSGELRNEMDDPHILIVDDSDESRAMYALNLAEKGYLVSKAHSGEQALEMAWRLRPDIIILHLWLPKINGWELTRRLKSDERTKDIPILVLAGQTLALPRECDGFLRKPFKPHELDEEIAHRLSALRPVSLLAASA